MLIAHLSDLHLRDGGDAAWLERQLDRIAAERPDHLAITGDILDRWAPALFARVLDALAARDLLSAEQTSIIHGNHDLASSGGHPRERGDLWRLGLRFWDPPPLMHRRRRRFYEVIDARAAGVAVNAPSLKVLGSGSRIAVLDTIPFSWIPFTIERGAVVLRHAVGTVPREQSDWLAAQPQTPKPLIVLMHHFPVGSPSFDWTPGRPLTRAPRVVVPMHVPEREQEEFWTAAESAGVRLVLCGHVHRASLSWHGRIAVGLNGQSGAEWAGRTVAWYHVTAQDVSMRLDRTDDI